MAKELQHHPIVKDLPWMADDDLKEFIDDISFTHEQLKRPFRHRIVLLDGMILDGRHRYKAARQLKIDLDPDRDFEQFNRKLHGEPLDWVMSQMKHRRRTPSIKTAEVVILADHVPTSRGDGRKLEILSKRFGVSETNAVRLASIRRKSPKLFGEVASGKINCNVAFTRFNHRSREKQVETLRLSAGVTMKDCELRHGDNVLVMSTIERGTVQVIFADPPYNCGWLYRNDETKDRRSDEDYFRECRAWMKSSVRVLRPGGSLFVLIDDKYTDHVGMLLRETGLIRRPTIICWETFANYNSAETSLSKNARYLHWYTKTDKPLINTVEARIESWRQDNGDARAVTHGRMPPNVWDFTRVTSQADERCPWLGKPGEAPQLPRSLPERAILLTSNPGDLVVDPFNGNGITGIAAILNDRKYIGIDRDKKGLEQSRSWIAHEVTRLKKEKA